MKEREILTVEYRLVKIAWMDQRARECRRLGATQVAPFRSDLH